MAEKTRADLAFENIRKDIERERKAISEGDYYLLLERLYTEISRRRYKFLSEKSAVIRALLESEVD